MMKTKNLFLALCMGMLMLGTTASAEKKKTTNLLIGVTPLTGRTATSIQYSAKGSPKDKFTYNKDLGITIGIERVINGAIILPELRYFHGNMKTTKLATGSTFPYTKFDDVNEFGFMQWLGFTANSKKRVQFPLMAGVGFDYMKGAPLENVFLTYGVKARVKIYFSTKVGMFLGGAYEGGSSHSSRGLPSDSSEKYSLNKTMPYGEVGLTVTL